MKRQIFIILFSIFRRRFHNETIDFQKNENVNIPICKCLNFTNCKGRKTTWKTRLNFDFKIIIVQMFRERNLPECMHGHNRSCSRSWEDSSGQQVSRTWSLSWSWSWVVWGGQAEGHQGRRSRDSSHTFPGRLTLFN